MFFFRRFQDDHADILILADAALTGGRAPDNDIHLDHPSVPEVAFRLTVEDKGCFIKAAYPDTRLAINGVRIASGRLIPGDRLEVGAVALVLDHAPEEGPPAALGAVTPAAGPAARRPGGLPFDEGLAELCALVAEERNLKVLLSKLMSLLLRAFGADEAFLFTLDAAGRPEVLVSSRDVGEDGNNAAAGRLFSDTVVVEALRSRRGLVLGNALADPAFARSGSINDLRLHSVLACPIVTAGRPGGLIYLGSRRPIVSFGPADLRELEVYALVAGCLINHVAFIARQDRVLASLREGSATPGMVAFCAPMRRVVDEIRAVAAGEISVLLQGETGTGKDVAAHLLHRLSRRKDRPFLVVNCSTLRGEILASELFGHRKGAFTGAISDQKGLFLSADGGTLFLDEIGEMDLPLQAMLLRALETGRVRPVGQAQEISADVRIVCATNRDLEAMVEKGTFRRDLYYRINQHAIHLPPLKERGEDILVLAHHFLEKTRALYPDRRIEGFAPESEAAMAAYAWPGNVRELANVVHKAVLFCQGPLARVDLPTPAGFAGDVRNGAAGDFAPLEDATRRFQRDYIQKALARCGEDKEKAAALLGIGRSTFFRHLAQGRDEA